MRINTFLATGLLLASAMLTSDFAMAAGSSINDSFDALANSKGGSKSAAGLDAFDDMANSKGNSDAGTGHGIETGLQSIEANRAEKKAKAAELKRMRMEEEAKKQDEYLASNCDCRFGEYADGRCASGLILIETCYSADHRREIPCAPMGEDERQVSAAAKTEKHRLCAAWKADGPKANSASFIAQLAQQYAVIESSKRKWEEEDRKRNEMIRADDRNVIEQVARDEKNKQQSVRDAENSRQSAQKAKEDANAAEGEAKLHQWCMTGNNIGYCSCWKWAPKGGNACMK